jgi:hypothetical protein
MTSAMTAFAIAVGGVSLACFLLMTRAENRSSGRASRDGSGLDGGGYAEGNGGSIFGWFGGDHSATDGSGSPVNGGGADSGGGGDGGGGGGDSGGGGDGGGGGSD